MSSKYFVNNNKLQKIKGLNRKENIMNPNKVRLQ